VSGTSPDFYPLEDLLEAEEIEIRNRVRDVCAREVTPRINDYWERAEFPFELVPRIAELLRRHRLGPGADRPEITGLSAISGRKPAR
jgi:hypothetical protein